MKDGTTHLAYKPEHALDTGVIVAIHPADQGDTQTLAGTLEQAMLDLIGRAPESPAEMVADTGYHSRVKALEDSAWKSRISEKEKAFARWHGDDAARRYNNRARLTRPARLSNCAPKRSSAASPSSSTSAACAPPAHPTIIVSRMRVLLPTEVAP